MKRYVSPSCSWRRTIRFSTWACTDTSSAETASSATMNSGSTASARAIPIRCRWPPLNWCGLRSADPGASPTVSSSSSTRSRRASRGASRCTFSTSSSVWRTVIVGLSEE